MSDDTANKARRDAAIKIVLTALLVAYGIVLAILGLLWVGAALGEAAGFVGTAIGLAYGGDAYFSRDWK